MLQNINVFESDTEVCTYEIADYKRIDEIFESTKDNIVNQTIVQFDDLFVSSYGSDNRFPLTVQELLKNNHILPELIEKQIKFLYGQGPVLYTEKITDNKKEKVYIEDAEVFAWLESWEMNGIREDYKTYLINAIREFYYTEGIFNKIILSKGVKFGIGLPISGIEVLSAVDCRLATKNKLKYINSTRRQEDVDFNFVMVGDWNTSARQNFKQYSRLDRKDPLKTPQSVEYVKNSSFGENIYSYPVFFEGLKNWIAGSNSIPIQLKSFLKNILTAKFHVKIPGAWIDKKREILKDVIERNFELKENGKPIVTEFNAVKLADSAGTPLYFSETMLNTIVNNELKKITELMSGEKNAGKLWSTQKYFTQFGLEEWEIVEIPLKISEFVTSLINYDKRAVEVILEGKGIDTSISNVSKDGIISNSGSNVYYNYLIYMNTLQIPEEICTSVINRAIKINFPNKKIKLGFYHNLPEKQQDVSPKDRMKNNEPNN